MSRATFWRLATPAVLAFDVYAVYAVYALIHALST